MRVDVQVPVAWLLTNFSFAFPRQLAFCFSLLHGMHGWFSYDFFDSFLYHEKHDSSRIPSSCLELPKHPQCSMGFHRKLAPKYCSAVLAYIACYGSFTLWTNFHINMAISEWPGYPVHASNRVDLFGTKNQWIRNSITFLETIFMAVGPHIDRKLFERTTKISLTASKISGSLILGCFTNSSVCLTCKIGDATFYSSASPF